MIALGAAILWTAAACASDSAFTDYEQIVDVAFPAPVLLRRNSKPTPREEKLISSVREVSLRLIESAGPAWFGPLAAPETPTPAQWRATLDVLRRTPVWLCNEGCAGCRQDAAGCAAAKEFGDSVASVIFLRKCALDPRGCPRRPGATGAAPAPSAVLFGAMKESLSQVAFFKVHGAKEKLPSDKPVQRALAALDASSVMMNNLLQSCPGPFPESGLGFLARTGHLKPIGPFADECARRLLAPLLTEPLPGECRFVADREKWKALRGAAWDSPSAMRCDDFCEFTTCGGREAPGPRLLRFGAKWVLSVPEGACDGSGPSDPRAFAERIVWMAAKAEVLSRPGAETFVGACARALVPRAAPAAPPAAPRREGGADVELVE